MPGMYARGTRARFASFVGMACALLGVVVKVGPTHAQERRPPGSHSGPSRVPQQRRDSAAAFKRLEFEGVRFQLLALNDESCPLQIRSGRITKTAVGTRNLTVEVQSVLDAPADSFLLSSLVFDASGTLKADRTAGPGGPVPLRQAQSLEIPLNRASLVAGDYVVLSLKEVAWSEGPWRSDVDEVRMAAREAVTVSAARKSR